MNQRISSLKLMCLHLGNTLIGSIRCLHNYVYIYMFHLRCIHVLGGSIYVFTFTLRTWWLHKVDLHDGDQRGIQVVSLRLFSVKNLNRVGTARNRKDWLQ